MPIINTNYGGVPTLTNPALESDVKKGKEYIGADGNKKIGNNSFEKLLMAKNIIPTGSGTIDLFPEDFENISSIGDCAFNQSKPLHRVILPKSLNTSGSSTGAQNFFAGCAFLIVYIGCLSRAMINGCSRLKLVIYQEPTAYPGIGFGALLQTTALKTIIFPYKKVIPLISTTSYYGGGHPMYVPDLNESGESLVAEYKSATNWSEARYADYIHGFSEAPTFDNSVTYECADVCKYNNKFYAYYHYTPTSNPPTGTTENNDYWWYCGEIEVSV